MNLSNQPTENWETCENSVHICNARSHNLGLTLLALLRVGQPPVVPYVLILRGILRGFSTFTHADGAALLVLAVAVAAVLVAGEGGALDAATHLAAMFVPPEGRQTQTTGIKKRM